MVYWESVAMDEHIKELYTIICVHMVNVYMICLGPYIKYEYGIGLELEPAIPQWICQKIP